VCRIPQKELAGVVQRIWNPICGKKNRASRCWRYENAGFSEGTNELQ